MPLAKLRPINMLDAMRGDEGNGSLDNFIRQAIGKEPLLSFSRTGDSPVQWIQLLHALDQQDVPGWPLLTPVKLQMQKCDKCSQEFCSSINYRRHIRVHRRSLNPDKDSTLSRDLLGAFWDKLSYDEAKETVSFSNVSLEEVSGSSIVKALTSFIRKPGFSSLPHVYVKAGSALLDIVQVKDSIFPISSHELFSILDDASEKTFLRGMAVSLQRYIFDGEAGKIGFEKKNLIACTSFLVEQKLVQAWVADKDAEALRCQKLLVEEEEAAQKRKAVLLERKRQKKLRQKEQKAKEQAHEEKADLKERLADSTGELAIDPSNSPVASDFDSQSPATSTDSVPSFLDPILHRNDQVSDVEPQSDFCNSYFNLRACVNGSEHQMVQESGRRQLVAARWQVQKSRRNAPNGFHGAQVSYVSKHSTVQRLGANKEPRGALAVDGNKVWTRKPKQQYDEVCFKNRLQKEVESQPDQSQSYEVLIGSIAVELGTSSSQQQVGPVELQDDGVVDNESQKKSTVQEEADEPDPAQCGVSRSTFKLWRPISRQETRDSEPTQSDEGVSEVDVVTQKANAGSLSSESCLTSCAMDEGCNGSENNSVSPMEESANSGGLWFSICAAEAFLTQRWKKAVAADHVQLVLSPDLEPPGCPEIETNGEAAATPLSPKPRRILCSAENRLANGTAFECSSAGTTKAKLRVKQEKGVKLKYIPKPRTNA